MHTPIASALPIHRAGVVYRMTPVLVVVLDEPQAAMSARLSRAGVAMTHVVAPMSSIVG